MLNKFAASTFILINDRRHRPYYFLFILEEKSKSINFREFAGGGRGLNGGYTLLQICV